MKRSLLPLFLLLFAAAPVQAQTQVLQVESSVPAHGAANVGLTSTVSFTFNRALSSAAEAFAYIDWYGEFEIDGYPGLEEATLSNADRTVTFPVTHLPDHDYVWIVEGYEFDFETLAEVRPYVLHYTTAATAGAYSVSGTVTVQTEPPPGKTTFAAAPVTIAGSAPLRASARAGRNEGPAITRPAIEGKLSAVQQLMEAEAMGLGAASAQATDAGNTLVYLVDTNASYLYDNIRAAAVAGEDGSFTIDHVRPGTYLLIALKFDYTITGSIWSWYLIGSHGAEVDGVADPITITSASVSDADVTIQPISAYSTTSAEAEASARAAAEAFTDAGDLELIGIQGGDFSFFFFLSGDLDFDGEYPVWEFYYYSADLDQVILVTREAFVNYVEIESHGLSEEVRSFPGDYKNSTELTALLEADSRVADFFENRAEAGFLVFLQGGDYNPLFDVALEDYPDHILWVVTIWAFDDTGDISSLTAHVDIATGEILNIEIFQASTAKVFVPTAIEAVATWDVNTDNLALFHILGDNVNAETGTTTSWEYMFDGGEEGVYDTFISFLGTFAFPSSFVIPEGMPYVPAVYLDSDAAMVIAEANGGASFRSEYTDATVSLEGGYALDLVADHPDLVAEHPEIETTPVWVAIYTGYNFFLKTGAAVDPTLIVVMDMANGEVITTSAVGVSNETGGELAQAVTLFGSYPNPFRSSTRIPFTLPSSRHVTIKVYDVLGREVATLADGMLPAGEQTISWEANGAPSGVYVVRLTAGATSRSQTVVLRK